MAQRTPAVRLIALDGLRGLAALVVVFSHAVNAVEMPLDVRQALMRSPLTVLLNGQGAVQLFFVLSGFVLASSLSRNRGAVDTLQFYVRRFFRIYPPYVFGLVLTWCASFFYLARPPGQGLTDWILMQTHVHITGDQLLRSLLYPGPAFGQFPIGWTLTVETIFSVLLPAMFLIALRFHWIVLVGLSGFLLQRDHLTFGYLWYAIDFSAGIALFLERDRLAGWFARRGIVATLLWVFGAVLLFAAPSLVGWSKNWEGIVVSGIDPWGITVMALGSTGIVASALYSRAVEAVLVSRPVAFLGRISYSLYLVHFGVLLLCTRLVSPPVGLSDTLGLIALVAGISIGISAISYRAVERPAIRVGNAVCRRLALRLGTEPRVSRLPKSTGS